MMCGLMWARRRNGKPAIEKIKKIYNNQKSRGQSGFGCVVIENGIVGELLRTRYEHEFFGEMKNSKATEILAHHRIPTSTPNVPECNHPIPIIHSSLKYDYVGIHNGHIRNASALKLKYEKEGFIYGTEIIKMWKTKKGDVFNEYQYDPDTKFTDSESLMIDLAKAIENPTQTKLESEGRIAFIILQIDKETRKPRRLYYGRNTNPLVLQVTEHLLSLSSEGKGEEVSEHKLFYLDYETGKFELDRELDIGEKYTPVKTTCYDGSKNKHKHNFKNVNTSYTDKDKNIKLPVWYKGKQYADFKDIPELNDKNMGFDTRKPFQLPFHVKLESKEVEHAEDYGLCENPDELFKGFEDIGITVTLSMRVDTYETMGELENAYISAIEQVAYYQDLKEIHEKNPRFKAQVEEDEFLLENCLEDEMTLHKEIKKWFPEKFAQTCAEFTRAKNDALLVQAGMIDDPLI